MVIMDTTDRKILRLLSQDGRMTQAALAENIGLSRPAVIERLRKLEKSGVIRGYHAILDNKKLGKPIQAMVAISYRGGTISTEEETAILSLSEEPDIIECYKMAGEDAAMLKIMTESIETLEQILTRIRNLDLVFSSKTMIILSTYFEKFGVQV
jgi:Lrp/AsnC family leucine-responsive transcriptional regulator